MIFLIYTSVRSYAIFGITDSYEEALKTYWFQEPAMKKIILIDPKWPVLYWGYGDIEPTYITLATSVEGNTVELLPGYDWSGYESADLTKIDAYTHEIQGHVDSGYVNGVDEDTYQQAVLFGHGESSECAV